MFGSFPTFVMGKNLSIQAGTDLLHALLVVWVFIKQRQQITLNIPRSFFFPQLCMLNMTPFGMGYLLVLLGSAVLSMSTPNILCALSLPVIRLIRSAIWLLSNLSRFANLLMFEIKRQVRLLNAEGKSFLQSSLKPFWAPQPSNLPLILALLISCLPGMTVH